MLKLITLLFLFFSAFSYSVLGAIAFGVVMLFSWGAFLWYRVCTRLNRNITSDLPFEIREITTSITTGLVRWTLPLTKATMDLGREVGKFKGLIRYMSHRVFSKPLVLTFHHLGNSMSNRNDSNSRYYYSIERFEKLIQDCQREGRRIATLAELVWRLRENPRSLYFEKTVAITFDDAYLCIYSGLRHVLREVHIPITVFVPTAYAGKSNQWDFTKGLDYEEILDWQQLALLKKNGVDIASHSRHHPMLIQCDSDVKSSEILGSLEDLKNIFPDTSQFLFSYPYGANNEEIREIVKSAGYIGAVANWTGNILPYTNPFEIPRFTVYAENDWKSVSDLSRSMWIKELIKDIRDWLRR